MAARKIGTLTVLKANTPTGLACQGWRRVGNKLRRDLLTGARYSREAAHRIVLQRGSASRANFPAGDLFFAALRRFC